MQACAAIAIICAVCLPTAEAQKKRAPAQIAKKVATPIPGQPASSGPPIAVKLKPAKKAAPARAQARAQAKPLPAKAEPQQQQQSARQAAAPAPSSSQDSGASKSILSMRASWSAEGPRLAETGALGLDGQYVIVPASFVSEVWTSSGDARFYVEDSTQPLDLIVFELTSDIAVFYSRVRVPASINRNRVRTEAPSQAEALVSLAKSAPSAEVRRSGSWTEGSLWGELYNSVSGSTPSRFIFDRNGRWVSMTGVRKARGVFNGDHGASSSRVLELIAMWEANPQKSTTDRRSLLSQLASWQNVWVSWFFEASRRGPSLRWLDCQASPAVVREPAMAGDIEGTRTVNCNSVAPLPLGGGYNAGVQVVRGDLALRRDVKQFLMNDKTSGSVFAESLFAAQNTDTGNVNVLTVPECQKSDVMNKMGKKFQLRFCTSALKNHPGLSDTAISVISTDTGTRASLIAARLKGFDPNHTKRFMQWMLDSGGPQ